MRFTLSLLSLFLFVSFGYSQDTIQLVTGDKIVAKVISITDYEMKYLKHDNLEGPSYFLKLNKVANVTYKNGSSEVFNKKNDEPLNGAYSNSLVTVGLGNRNNLPPNPFNNSVGINLAMLLLRQLEVDYEHRFKNSMLAIGVPLNYTLDQNFTDDYFEEIYAHAQLWSAGVDLNIYLDRDIFFSTYYDAYIGFGLDFGQANYFQEIHDSIPNGYTVESKNVSREFYSISMSVGAEIYASDQLSFQAGAKLIGRNYLGTSTYDNGFETVRIGEDFNLLLRPQVRLKYRF